MPFFRGQDTRHPPPLLVTNQKPDYLTWAGGRQPGFEGERRTNEKGIRRPNGGS